MEDKKIVVLLSAFFSNFQEKLVDYDLVKAIGDMSEVAKIAILCNTEDSDECSLIKGLLPKTNVFHFNFGISIMDTPKDIYNDNLVIIKDEYTSTHTVKTISANTERLIIMSKGELKFSKDLIQPTCVYEVVDTFANKAHAVHKIISKAFYEYSISSKY